MPRGVTIGASVTIAALAWALLGWLLYDAAANVRVAPPREDAPVLARADPCRLGEPLAVGFDRRCDLEVRFAEERLVLRLDETWQGNLLSQRLVVGSSATPAFELATRSQPPGASRVTQLRALPAGPREHLAVTVGSCGGVTCPNHDVLVVGDAGGRVRELLRVRLGRGGAFELRGADLVLSDATNVLTYRLEGGTYVQREARARTASPQPSPSRR